jgi:hypothetical protein
MKLYIHSEQELGVSEMKPAAFLKATGVNYTHYNVLCYDMYHTNSGVQRGSHTVYNDTPLIRPCNDVEI